MEIVFKVDKSLAQAAELQRLKNQPVRLVNSTMHQFRRETCNSWAVVLSYTGLKLRKDWLAKINAWDEI